MLHIYSGLGPPVPERESRPGGNGTAYLRTNNSNIVNTRSARRVQRQEFRSETLPRQKPQGVNDYSLGEALADHFRFERACTAARRFISKGIGKGEPVGRSAVVTFLRKRRDPLPEDQIERCADEAMSQWSASRSNRWRA